MKYSIFSLLIAICCVSRAGAQQLFSNFTQHMQQVTAYNPAYALVAAGGEVNVTGRKQWAGIDGAPTTFLLNAYVPVDKIKAAAGITLLEDKTGVERFTDFNAFFAKSVTLSDKLSLAAHFNAGYRQFRADYSSLDADDPKYRENVKNSDVTIGLGLMLYAPELFYVGISAPHVRLTDISSASQKDYGYLKNTTYLTAAYLHDFDGIKLKPGLLVYYTPGMSVQGNFSAMLYFMDALGVGASYRTTNEAAGIVSYLFDEHLQAGYSYQVGIGRHSIGRLANATHEITLGYRFGRNITKRFL